MLRDIQRQSRTSIASSGLLEFRDERSWSPLLVASAKGHYKCAELVGSPVSLLLSMPSRKEGKASVMSYAGVQLARHGANVHHVSVRPDGTTALHECVARGYDRLADLLLNYGASPFLENGRGELQSWLVTPKVHSKPCLLKCWSIYGLDIFSFPCLE